MNSGCVRWYRNRKEGHLPQPEFWSWVLVYRDPIFTRATISSLEQIGVEESRVTNQIHWKFVVDLGLGMKRGS